MSLACGTPQTGGPRRDAGIDDGRDGDDAGGPSSCSEVSCREPAFCIERVGASVSRAECECPSGYNVQNNGCVDIDECARPEDNDCGENSVCENRLGSFGCSCKPGFTLEGETCKSLDSCVGAENTCHPVAACTLDAAGAVSCMCSQGYMGDGRSCVDVDECANGTAECADNAHCINTRRGPGYTCACDALYTGDGKVQCRERCDAAQADSSRCDPGGHGRCVIGPSGRATCTSCSADATGDGRRCEQNSACQALGCGANTVCAGSGDARQCACAPGFEGDPMQGCEDINECATGMDSCDPSTSRCTNTDGSHVCVCSPGFEWGEDGTCVNVDECARELDRCDPNAKCIDKAPGYSCECAAGYALQEDGLSCADIDECANGTAECRADDKFVMCVNTSGSYDCRCPSGYAGNGETEACYCDLSGVWAVRQDATLALKARAVAGTVLIATSVTYASIWELHKYRYDGEKLVSERRPCGSDVMTEVYSPLFNETYTQFTPNMVLEKLPSMAVTDVPLSRSMALPGSTFTTPRSAMLQGIRMDDPVNDPWPVRGTDVPANRWVDIDGDGEPGLSLWPGSTNTVARTGMGQTYSYLPVAFEDGTTIIDRRAGCVSVAIRTSGSMRVNIDRCDRWTGTLLDTKAEGRVRSCTVLPEADWESGEISCDSATWRGARRCNPEEVKFLDDQEQTNTITATFEMQKLGPLDGADLDCAAVRAKLPAIVRGQ